MRRRRRGGRSPVLTRASTGLLFADSFNRADGVPGANYNYPYAPQSGGVAIASGKLILQAGTIVGVTAAGFTSRRDMHHQLIGSRASLGGYLTTYTRWQNIDNHFDYSHRLNNNPPQFYLRLASTYYLIGAGTFNTEVANTPVRYTISALNTDWRAWSNGVLQASTTDGGLSVVGTVAVGAGGTTIAVSSIIVCAARTITVNGLPAGYKTRVGALVSAAAVAATPLVLDIAGSLLPVALLEILNASNAVVISTVIGVYGGDVLTYAA